MLVVDNKTAYTSVLSQMHKYCFNPYWDEKEFHSLLILSNTVLWVEEQGFLLCSYVLDEMEVLTIGVMPDYRRKGIGRRLIEQMISFAADNQIKKIFLEVRIDNESAKNLYTRFGFSQTGIRKGYYTTESGLTDALCLTKVMD